MSFSFIFYWPENITWPAKHQGGKMLYSFHAWKEKTWKYWWIVPVTTRVYPFGYRMFSSLSFMHAKHNHLFLQERLPAIFIPTWALVPNPGFGDIHSRFYTQLSLRQWCSIIKTVTIIHRQCGVFREPWATKSNYLPSPKPPFNSGTRTR